MNGKSGSHDDTSSPLKFPCSFSIKVMGKNNEDFADIVLNIVKKEFPEITLDSIKTTPSKNNQYISLSVSVEAKNKDQLDRTYQALTDCPDVLISL